MGNRDIPIRSWHYEIKAVNALGKQIVATGGSDAWSKQDAKRAAENDISELKSRFSIVDYKIRIWADNTTGSYSRRTTGRPR